MNLPPLPLRRLDLNLLKVFDVVMVERNVTRAAVRLAMTQPAVSNALRRLRESTQQELFVPHPGGVTPTAAAQALWPVVREALQRLHEVLESDAFDPVAADQSFTVAMADATAALFVPVLVEALQRQRSGVNLMFMPLNTRDPRPMLHQGQADVAVGFFPEVNLALQAEGTESATRSQALYACRYVCVMRREHPLAQPGALNLQAYCDAQHVRVSFAGRARGFVDESLAALGLKRRVMVTVNQFSTAGSVVQNTDLLTVLPRSFLPATGCQDQLAVSELPFPLRGIDVGLLWHARHDRNPAHRWLRQALAQAAGEIVARVESIVPAGAASLTTEGRGSRAV
jgi:DNA-binding transcriptional LysR family regulator